MQLACLFLLCACDKDPAASTSPSQSSEQEVLGSVSGNPAADNIVPGTGFLGRSLGLAKSSGIRVGGLWLADSNIVMSGGSQPGDVTWNSMLLLGVNVDAEELLNLRGASFAAEFMQVDTQPTNWQAGSVQGYNSLDASGGTVVDRSQLYQAWYMQELCDDKVSIRIGKQVPTYDFANVSRPAPESNESLMIPAVTGLLYTPIFVSPSMLGVMGGYYNSVYGISIGIESSENTYVRLGIYDGNLANGVQTGVTGPEFNGYTFSIAECGVDWILSKEYPGEFGVGAWYQTGSLEVTNLNNDVVRQDGTAGLYCFGGQRLWSNGEQVDGERAPEQSVSAFLQYGVNNSETMLMTQSVGGGLTAFGIVPFRPHDSMGIGASLAWLNQNTFERSSELMFQSYYQFQVSHGLFVQPTLTYIPTPGDSPDLDPAWAFTLRLSMFF